MILNMPRWKELLSTRMLVGLLDQDEDGVSDTESEMSLSDDTGDRDEEGVYIGEGVEEVISPYQQCGFRS